jgi:hypothetical protein
MAMMELSDVVRITGGRLIGQDVPIESVVIDGRRVAPGALFVAISGETFDGHEFLDQAASGPLVPQHLLGRRRGVPVHHHPGAEGDHHRDQQRLGRGARPAHRALCPGDQRTCLRRLHERPRP